MIERHIKKAIDYSLLHFPCTILTGPRQVGKSTLLVNEYGKNGYSYVSLDDTSQKMLAKNDPKTFLLMHPYPLIIDEAQKAVELFDEIARIVNEKRIKEGNMEANGMYILSGSNRRDLLERSKESLAGRASILDMSPLSISEIFKRNNVPFIPNPTSLLKREKIVLTQDSILDLIVKGSLPELYDDEGLRSSLFYSSYISTYLAKDVREQIDLKDEDKFYNLLVLIASLTGQEINYDNMAKQIGVSAVTIKAWISILLKTGIVYLLQPYFENSWTKRIVKSPKLYFFDTGIACYLLGIDTKETLDRSFLKGRLFETFVINEIRKSYDNNGEKISFYYYRDYNQNEVDLVYIRSGAIYCVECKYGKEHHFSNMRNFKQLDETNYEKGNNAIVCTADSMSVLSNNVLIVPVKDI